MEWKAWEGFMEEVGFELTLLRYVDYKILECKVDAFFSALHLLLPNSSG